MPKIELIIPTIQELYFRQEMQKDKDTMKYNAGYSIDINGYNYEDGTITLTDSEMKDWYHRWIGVKDKYYAYIMDTETKKYVGEIYFYNTPEIKAYSMGIVISYKSRGKGYSKLALEELERIAFEEYNVNALSDMIPIDRIGAIKTFESAGFIRTNNIEKGIKFGKEEEAVQMLLTKKHYQKILLTDV